MSKEVIIKDNGIIKVSIDVNRGYIIRLKNHKGATFTVTNNMTIEIGQSSKLNYSIENWGLILQEIEEGIKYMTKVRLSGSFPAQVTDYNCQTIRPSQYMDNSLYTDEKGRVIFYIGKAKSCSALGNRVGCDYLYGIIDNIRNIQSDGSSIHISCSSAKFDSYRDKPSKLVKQHNCFDRNISELIIHTGCNVQYRYKFKRF